MNTEPFRFRLNVTIGSTNVRREMGRTSSKLRISVCSKLKVTSGRCLEIWWQNGALTRSVRTLLVMWSVRKTVMSTVSPSSIQMQAVKVITPRKVLKLETSWVATTRRAPWSEPIPTFRARGHPQGY